MHGNLEMRRKSSRKVVVVREPNGRIQRERVHGPTEIKRLRDAAIIGLRDPEWGTELGRLFLHRNISAEMYLAGKRWREDAASYRGSIGVFPVRSSGQLDRGRSEPPDPDSENGQDQARRDRNAAERFFEGDSVLALAGGGPARMVRTVVEDDLGLCGHQELLDLRVGLLALARHYSVLT